MKTLTRNAILCLAATTVLVGTATQSASAAGSTFPGVSCETISGARPGYRDGAIFNRSASRPLRLICPIVSGTTSGTGAAWVKVTDRSGGGGGSNVRCELFNVVESDGNSTPTRWRSGIVASVGFGSDVQKLEFDVSSFNENIPSYAESHRYLLCTLPPRAANGPSEIHSYSLIQ